MKDGKPNMPFFVEAVDDIGIANIYRVGHEDWYVAVYYWEVVDSLGRLSRLILDFQVPEDFSS